MHLPGGNRLHRSSRVTGSTTAESFNHSSDASGRRDRLAAVISITRILGGFPRAFLWKRWGVRGAKRRPARCQRLRDLLDEGEDSSARGRRIRGRSRSAALRIHRPPKHASVMNTRQPGHVDDPRIERHILADARQCLFRRRADGVYSELGERFDNGWIARDDLQRVCQALDHLL